MTGQEILKYISFGASCLYIIIIFPSERVYQKRWYWYYVLIGFVLAICGLYLEINDVFRLEKGLTTLIMSISLIYLFFFGLFLFIFKGMTDSVPYRVGKFDRIGKRPLTNNKWIKFDSNRRIMWTDYLFTFLVTMIPIVLIFALMIRIMRN